MSTSTDKHISCSCAGRAGVFTNQWETNSGLPASQTSLLLSGASCAEQAGWAALISSVVLFFFPLNHTGERVCVWDAGMHGANPPLSGNAWTASKTLLLLLLLSMLIRHGLRCMGGGGLHRCNSRLTSQDIHSAVIVNEIINLADLMQTFKVSTEDKSFVDNFRWGRGKMTKRF